MSGLVNAVLRATKDFLLGSPLKESKIYRNAVLRELCLDENSLPKSSIERDFRLSHKKEEFTENSYSLLQRATTLIGFTSLYLGIHNSGQDLFTDIRTLYASIPFLSLLRIFNSGRIYSKEVKENLRTNFEEEFMEIMSQYSHIESLHTRIEDDSLSGEKSMPPKINPRNYRKFSSGEEWKIGTDYGFSLDNPNFPPDLD